MHTEIVEALGQKFRLVEREPLHPDRREFNVFNCYEQQLGVITTDPDPRWQVYCVVANSRDARLLNNVRDVWIAASASARGAAAARGES